jgi:chromosomal replication initiator protein
MSDPSSANASTSDESERRAGIRKRFRPRTRATPLEEPRSMPTPSQTLLWDQALADLRGKLDRTAFATWIEPVQLVAHEGGSVVLSAPNQFVRNWLINTYHEQIADTLSGLQGREIDLEIVLRDDDEGEDGTNGDETGMHLSVVERQAVEQFRRGQSPARLAEISEHPLNARYSFDNYVVGESNRFAHAAALAVGEPSSRVYNPLFIYGGVGLGKTHLMQAIGHRLKSYGRHFNVLYVSSETFMNAFIESVAQKRMADFRNCFRNVDLLMVDDVQFFSGAEQTQTEFFHTFNALYDSGKKIVISSDHPPKELTALEERLRSRFESGLIVDIQPPDLETRVAILRQMARAMGLELPREVSIYIAERIRSNLRKLEGALKRLSAHVALTGGPVTIETSRGLLGPLLQGDEPLRISPEKVQMAICRAYGITMHEMTGPNRSRKFSVPRQLAMYLTRDLTTCSYPEIARKFGGRDHSSVIHAVRKVEKDLARDLKLQNQIKYLSKLIKEEPGIH